MGGRRQVFQRFGSGSCDHFQIRQVELLRVSPGQGDGLFLHFDGIDLAASGLQCAFHGNRATAGTNVIDDGSLREFKF